MVDISSFEVFTDPKRGMKPVASIRGNGQIGLNHGAVEKYKLKKYKAAILLFSSQTRQIAIELKATSTNAPGEVSLRVMGKDSQNGTIGAKQFLNAYDIPYGGKTRRFDVQKHEDGGREFLIFDTNKQLNADPPRTP